MDAPTPLGSLDQRDGCPTAPVPSSRTLRKRLIRGMIAVRLPLLVIVHLIVFYAVYSLAFLQRFDFRIPEKYVPLYWSTLPIILAIKLVIFYGLKNFHGWWRYVTFADLVGLVRAATVSTLVIVAVDHFAIPQQIPRGIVITDWGYSIVALALLRSVLRLWDERIVSMSSTTRRRALLVGDDNDAARLAHLMNSLPARAYAHRGAGQCTRKDLGTVQ